MALIALTDLNQIPASTADACREYDYRYSMAASSVAAPGWSQQYGDYIEVKTPNVRYPLEYVVSKYKEFRGEIITNEYKDGFFDLTTTELQCGYEMSWIKLSTNPLAPKQWYANAQRFVNNERRTQNTSVAALLTGNAVCAWDKVALFSASHLVNPTAPTGATWGNIQVSATDLTVVANLLAEVTAMQSAVVDINGEMIEVDPDLIFAGPLLASPLEFMLSQSLINNATNPYYKKFTVVRVAQPGMAKNAVIYDSKLAAEMPGWLTTKFVPPDPTGNAAQLRFFDENSDHFKNTGHLKVSSHIHYGFAPLFPHAMRFVTGPS